MHLRTTLADDLREVSTARRAVASALSTCGVPVAAVDVAVLLTSELVTNAIRHGRPPVEVSAHMLAAGGLRVEVRDVLPGPVTPRRRNPWAENGRGLQLVESLADTWGCINDSDGKTVWFEVPLGLPSPPPNGHRKPGRSRTARDTGSRAAGHS